jgi:hypothetical protein
MQVNRDNTVTSLTYNEHVNVFMYVCMYLCMHACMYVCVYACMRACVCACVCMCVCVCMGDSRFKSEPRVWLFGLKIFVVFLYPVK